MEETVEIDEITNEVAADEHYQNADEHYQNKEQLMNYIQNLINILETKLNEGHLNMYEAYICYDAYLNINNLIKII